MNLLCIVALGLTTFSADQSTGISNKAGRAGKKHVVSHDDKAGCTTVSHLETVDCRDAASVAALLERAGKQRSVGATAANERSSRSHMVFTLTMRGARASDGQQLNGVHIQGSFVAWCSELMSWFACQMKASPQRCFPCALTPVGLCDSPHSHVHVQGC